MATEALVWPGPPSLTNGNDDTDYNLGCRFSLVAPQGCSGVVWERTPDVVTHTPTGGQWFATLWNWDTQAILAQVPFTPLAAVRQEVPFGVTVPLVNGVNYATTVFTRDYVFLASGGLDISTPSGNAIADIGVIGVSTDPDAYPGGTPASWYFIGPRMEVAGGPAEGTSDVGLNLAVSATGAAAHQGVAGVGLGLAVAAAGAAPAQGVVALSLNLAVAASGARSSGGSAALGLGLAPAATGARNSRGSVQLGVGLQVAAAGSNGESGRPVSPFPFTPRPVSNYPWTPRPVKSFQEVES